MKMWRISVAVAGLLLACLSSAQAVTWETRELVLEAEPGVAEVGGAFVFTNQTEEPFEVTSVKTSCGCTTAQLEQTTYAPGESGQIKVTFAVGDRTGEQVKKIVVRTDAPDAPVTTLTLKVGIPKLVEMTPRLLRWAAEEERGAKTVDVVFHEQHPIVVTQAHAADGVELKLEEVEEGLHYRVTVRPTGQEALRSIVTLATEQGEAEDQANPLRFLVRAAPGSAHGESAGQTSESSSGAATEAKPDAAVDASERAEDLSEKAPAPGA